jgi:hypothetical protein
MFVFIKSMKLGGWKEREIWLDECEEVFKECWIMLYERCIVCHCSRKQHKVQWLAAAFFCFVLLQKPGKIETPPTTKIDLFTDSFQHYFQLKQKYFQCYYTNDI